MVTNMKGFFLNQIDDILWLFSYMWCKIVGHKFNLAYNSMTTEIKYCTRCGTKEKWKVIEQPVLHNNPDVIPGLDTNYEDFMKTTYRTTYPQYIQHTTDEPLLLKPHERLNILWSSKDEPVWFLVDGEIKVKMYPGELMMVRTEKCRTGLSKSNKPKTTKKTKRRR